MHEKEMIEAILKGDQKAFKLLVDTYQLMVVNTCYAFVHDRDEAEDIAQDVFVQVFESLGRFRFESKLSTWLYRIAVNRSINHCKSPRGRAIKIDIDSWKQQEVAQSVEMPQQQILEEQEQIELLHKAIDKLPENQRTALILNKYEELSYKEIADVMGVSLSSVESLIFRAKNNLEKIFNTK
ncbi:MULTISPECIES: RNA polymerase sigma factor [Odoribacteraceae]|uniref:RNA polymerase sigma factor n=1 Tax=Odoribacteraceae TaxID=1853231 RepID=UPI000E4EEBEF|nr:MULTISPECIES: RNA polymerase sigma factor [Odoribacteraceae]MCQ4875059.1 RNA polymerase sigma factor [Butyricimonas paravirosa]RHR75267.1 RNA polymerase sigma factor [Odoribacter sp. AF15-53]